MDQNSTGGTDKRNWRERLGIGNKDLPKSAEGQRPAVSPQAGAAKPAPARPNPQPVSPVRPAPMAPRAPAAAQRAPSAVARPETRQGDGASRPVTRPAAPMASDALAAKLKSQRDAAEKMAEQRVQAAKSRAEASLQAPAEGKPKFTFADEDKSSAPRTSAPQVAPSPAPSRPSPALPPASGFAPQLQPPRPQLGANTSFQPRPPQAPQPQPGYVPTPSSGGYPQGYGQSPAYPPAPGYRPIDPATGYVPPPSYPPRQSFQPGLPPRAGIVPTRPPGYQQGDFAATAEGRRLPPRVGNQGPLRAQPVLAPEEDHDDVFEQPRPTTRRASATDYQKAYRDAELGFEQETPRSRVPLILLTLFALFLAVTLGSVYVYSHYIKTASTGADKSGVPVVTAPAAPVKTAPETTATGQGDAAAPLAPAATTKKQIYDRIVGDKEVPAGQMTPTEQVPVQPSATPPADPATAQPVPAAQPPTSTTGTTTGSGTGGDATPLPLPPPPGSGTGSTTGGTQGSLTPSNKTDQASITPAAEQNSAAVLPSPDTKALAAVATAAAGGVSATTPSNAETIEPVAAAPAAKTAPAKIIEPKKLAVKTEKSSGAKPLVLVAPSKSFVSAPASGPAVLPAPGAGVVGQGNSLYDGAAVQSTAGSAVAVAPPVEKKRRTLLDLFKSNSTPAPSAPQQIALATPAAPQPIVRPAPSVQSPSATGSYVAQLASFNSRADASAAYSKMVAKHGALISRYAPLIETADVAGATRYRLNIGPMVSSDVANSFCSSLFSAGERDCIVRRQ